MEREDLPKVWKWDNPTDSRSGNRPDAGARFEKELPVGDAPYQLYSLGTPNGIKITVMLEELKLLEDVDIDYNLYKIDISEGVQFGSDFVKINPNSKIPAMLDQSGDAPMRLFESGSILLYLAEKYGKFLPTDPADKVEAINWLFWQMGAAPYVGGGFGHFFAHSDVIIKYPIDRYTMETKRQLDLLDQVLAERPYIAGDEYTIADMAIWPWYGRLVRGEMYQNSAEFLDAKSYPHVKEWADRINNRPGVQNGLNVDYGTIH